MPYILIAYGARGWFPVLKTDAGEPVQSDPDSYPNAAAAETAAKQWAAADELEYRPCTAD